MEDLLIVEREMVEPQHVAGTLGEWFIAEYAKAYAAGTNVEDRSDGTVEGKEVISPFPLFLTSHGQRMGE